MLVTLAACLIGLKLSCSKQFVQVPWLPWGAEAPEQAKGMQLTIQSQVSNEYKICKRQFLTQFLRTICKFGFVAIRIS